MIEAGQLEERRKRGKRWNPGRNTVTMSTFYRSSGAVTSAPGITFGAVGTVVIGR
jgi:hypothetical protein